jgi:hypothetical protein
VEEALRNHLSRYEARYRRLWSEMREDWAQATREGLVRRARELSEDTGELFRSDVPPQFFVGALDAPFVLVHLNPKESAASLPTEAFDDYVVAQMRFGAQHYATGAPRWHSPFDHKQVRFLEPFGVIDFTPAVKAGDSATLRDLERVIDNKLQLELIPYASPSFRTHRVVRACAALDAHYQRVMSVITALPRDYVIFCGEIFDRVLAEHVVARQDHAFHLTKHDGTSMRRRSRFSRVTLRTRNGLIEAGIAQSFAQRGLPIGRYARHIKAIYR